MNKHLFTLALICISLVSSAQEEITIPASTNIPMELTQEIREGKNKVGSSVPFIVREDVKVRDVVVIGKGAPIRAQVTISKNRELRVDLYEVTAVDGSAIKLNDCWIFTTAAQNLNSKGGLIIKGTKKNCYTSVATKIKATGGGGTKF